MSRLMREPLVYDPDTDRLVPKSERMQAIAARSHLACPMIVTDAIEVVNQLDGQVYTSKSALRATYKAAGVEEVGNTRPTPKQFEKAPGLKDDLRSALRQNGL